MGVIRRIIPFMVVVLLVFSATAAQAQDNPITLSAEVGFEGFYRQGEWIPIHVTVSNSGSDVEGYLVVEQTGNSASEEIRYQVPISLPGQSRKTISFYVGVDKYQSSLTVKLMDGSRQLAAERARIKRADEGNLLFGVVSGELVDMTFLNAAVAYLNLDALPEVGGAWKALDALILNNVDTGTLNSAQLEALREWVTSGGHLIVTGGPNWRKTAANLTDLLPVSISGSASSYSLDVLANLSDETMDEGPFVIAQAQLTEGRTLLEQDDLPLLARRPYGLGQIDWLALDLTLVPLKDWAGNEALWNIILNETGHYAPWDTSTINYWAAREGLRSIPSLALPSALQMILFLTAYTVVVGPLNYLVLNRRKRRELGWITIPSIILLFSGLAYLTGFQLKGGAVVINRLSLVSGAAGAETGHARTMLGIFSPSRATYDLNLPEKVLARPIVGDDYYGGLGSDSSAVIEMGTHQVLKNVQVDVGGLRAFRATAPVQLPPISADLTIAVSNYPRLTGNVTNNSPVTLENATVLLGDSIFELGDLSPGKTTEVNLRLLSGQASQAPSLSSSSSGPAGGYYMGTPFPHYLAVEKIVGGNNYWNDKTLNRRYQILQAFVSQDQVSQPVKAATLIAWSEEDLWPIEVVGKESDTVDTIGYFLDLPIKLSTSNEKLVIPPTLTTWQAMDGNRYDESGPYNLYLANQWASFQYQPWDTFQLGQVDQLQLNVVTSNSQPNLRLALWNWRTGNWEVDESLGRGENFIDDPADYVGPNNAVRVRVESTSSTGTNITRMDVTFVGNVQ